MRTKENGTSQVDSPVKTYHKPVKDKVSTTKMEQPRGQVFGLKCGRQLGYYDQNTLSLKTLVQSLFENSPSSLLRLPKSGMMRNGKIYAQATWAVAIGARGFGLSATLRTPDEETNATDTNSLGYIHGGAYEHSTEGRLDALGNAAASVEQATANADSAKQQGGTERPEQIESWGRGERIFTSKDNWMEVAAAFCRVDDAVPVELYIINRFDNLLTKEINGKKINTTEEDAKVGFLTWEAMRKMWEHREIAKASHGLYLDKLRDIMPELPCESGSVSWFSEGQGGEELYRMWEEFYSKTYEEAQYLQCKLLEYYTQKERIRNVEKKERVNRLKGLGNAIVPQIAQMILGLID